MFKKRLNKNEIDILKQEVNKPASDLDDKQIQERLACFGELNRARLNYFKDKIENKGAQEPTLMDFKKCQDAYLPYVLKR